MLSIVLCVVVVGSCIAFIARYAGTAMEPATAPARPRRQRVERVRPERELEPEPEPDPEPVYVVPRRRPSPAEMARLAPATHPALPRDPWWVRAKAAASLTVISIVLGLLAASTVALVLFTAFTLLKSL